LVTNMVIGVTMVKVVPGQEKAVYNALQNIEGIKDVYHVFGEFDFVVIIEVEGLSTLNKLVDTIREIDNVTATQTVVGAEL
jgi:DNA-binding Lrp family transcriptional regulator